MRTKGQPNHTDVPHYGEIDPAVMADINVKLQNDPSVNPRLKMNAQAYAGGSGVHIGGGQEKHLPHELTHVVQQR